MRRLPTRSPVNPGPYLPGAAAYGAPKVAHPFSFDKGGWGAWEVAARYSYMNLNDHVTRGRAASLTGGVFGGKQQVYTMALNWYPNDNIRFMLDYYFTDVNRLDSTGINRSGSGSRRWLCVPRPTSDLNSYSPATAAAIAGRLAVWPGAG